VNHKLALVLFVLGCGGRTGMPHPDAAPPGGIVHRCDLADCQNGIARTCDAMPLSLDCNSFGASCSQFDDQGTAFSWCNCGAVAEGQGRCFDGRNGVTCQQGLGVVAQCLPGTFCIESPQSQYGLGCQCDNAADGVCPDPVCTDDPDCMTCTPSCTGKACGDNGCGGLCGSCAFGESCDSGTCTKICVPDCTGKQCGPDGCGGSCGTCDGTCSASGQCMGTCVPSCTGKVCGSDGCSGSCGSCGDGLECQVDGTCGCPFFATVTYTFTLDPNEPANFSFVGLNIQHINLDGSETSNGRDGGILNLTSNKLTFQFYGCKPHIRVSREYALSGIDCQAEDTYTDRTDFTIPAPTVNDDGSCTAPPL
jgi:hypothetical protein